MKNIAAQTEHERTTTPTAAATMPIVLIHFALRHVCVHRHGFECGIISDSSQCLWLLLTENEPHLRTTLVRCYKFFALGFF